MEFKLFSEIVKFPFIWDNTLYDSSSLPQHKNCLNCKKLDCLSLIKSNQSEYICEYGFNSFSFRISEGKVIINGLVADDNKIIKPGRKEARIKYFITRIEFAKYIAELNSISAFIDNGIKKNIQEKFTLFHDVRTSYAIAFSNLEALILTHPGGSFQEKLQHCNQKIIDLYDSLELVTSQIDLIDVMINPAAILQGDKREMNIFRLTHKLVKLFAVKAEKRNLTFEYRSNKNIPFGSYHDSIKLVPIILMENAIKYSEPSNKILITMDYINNKIIYSISTYGIRVPTEEVDLIFDKQKRGSNAGEYTEEGLGMGLYIAKRILNEHGGDIEYTFEPKNVRFGFNVFTFEV